jgi:hypothetical protein
VVVSQKLAADVIPVVGALGGAAVNAAFIDHFQMLARGHFTVRRLERIYGEGQCVGLMRRSIKALDADHLRSG